MTPRALRGSPSRRLRGLDVGDRHVELVLESRGKVLAQPARHALRQRRDDDLVDLPAPQGVSDGADGIGIADLAAGLVMAILGGAIMPVVQGRVMDVADTAVGFVVPAICLAFVAAYALFDLRTRRHGGPLVAEGAH